VCTDPASWKVVCNSTTYCVHSITVDSVSTWVVLCSVACLTLWSFSMYLFVLFLMCSSRGLVKRGRILRTLLEKIENVSMILDVVDVEPPSLLGPPWAINLPHISPTRMPHQICGEMPDQGICMHLLHRAFGSNLKAHNHFSSCKAEVCSRLDVAAQSSSRR
jgi:hypothetical protein